MIIRKFRSCPNSALGFVKNFMTKYVYMYSRYEFRNPGLQWVKIENLF